MNGTSVLPLIGTNGFYEHSTELTIYCSGRQNFKIFIVVWHYVNELYLNACCTCIKIRFPHSTNHIIDLQRCRFRGRRRFITSCMSDVDVVINAQLLFSNITLRPFFPFLIEVLCSGFGQTAVEN